MTHRQLPCSAPYLTHQGAPGEVIGIGHDVRTGVAGRRTQSGCVPDNPRHPQRPSLPSGRNEGYAYDARRPSGFRRRNR